MATDKPRFTITMDEDTLDLVDAYKYKNKINTQSKAIIRLVRKGLEEISEKSGSKKASAMLSEEALRVARDYSSLDRWGKQTVRSVLDDEHARCEDEARFLKETEEPKEPKVITLYSEPSAAGIASPVEGKDYCFIELGPDDPHGAAYAVQLQGDSMEPDFPDGSIVFVNHDAVEDGDSYVINGVKHFITGGAHCDFLCCFAITNKEDPKHGMTCFVVEKGTPGMKIASEDNKMGIRGARTAEIVFEDCRVPKENMVGKLNGGYRLALDVVDRGRIGIAAMAVGIGQAALDLAIKYSKEREVFKRPISKFQGIQWMLADAATQLEAARMLTYYAADLKEQGVPFTKQAAMAKLFAAEASHKVVDTALQIHGGYGYMKEYAIERIYRDQRITELFEGTSQVQKIVIAGQLLH